MTFFRQTSILLKDMSYLLDYLRRNIIFILLAFCLIAEVIVILPFKEVIYYAGIIYVASYVIRNNSQHNKFGTYYIIFLTVCLISSCLAFTLDYRLFAFVFLLIAFTPITTSFKIFVFRKQYLYFCLMFFPILAIASLLCYFFDINYYVPEGIQGGNELDFSAFFPHPMWLGAALGLSNIVLAWLVFSVKNKIFAWTYAVLLLLSVYLSVVAASRSAFFASVIAMFIFIVLKLHDLKKIFFAGIIISVIAVALLPFYIIGSKRMQDKFDKSQGKYGSRTELFDAGLSTFERRPLLGQGFAVKYNTEGEKSVGRMETGSGWLSILTQTGLLGFIIVCLLVLKVRKVFPYLFIDNKLLLYFSSFLYLCLHSCFEGYLLTVGYYPGVMFWTLLGFLHVYPYYKDKELKYIEILNFGRDEYSVSEKVSQ